MNTCIFEPTKRPGVYRCSACGYKTLPTHFPPERIHKVCTGKPDPSLPFKAKQVWNYAKALAKWIAAGRPERSPEQIAAILPICESCPHFNRLHRACSFCGCPCNEKPKAVDNLIAMATEGCKDDPPRWPAEVN